MKTTKNKGISEYENQALTFLKKTKTSLVARYLKHDSYFEGEKETRDIYQIMLKRGEYVYSFEFGQSLKKSVYYSLDAKFKLNILHNFFVCEDDAKRKIEQIYTLNKNRLDIRHDPINIIKHEREAPNNYDILACLTKYDPGTFENFCSDFGYNTDSKKDERIYNSAVDEYMNLKALFTDEELELMNEIN